MPHIHEKIDFTVSAYIVFRNKTLLIDHIALKKWLPVGGHIELDEQPEEALFREIAEESGLKKESLTVLSAKPEMQSEGITFLYTPNYLDIHTISSTHQHVGLTYFLCSNTDVVLLQPSEHQQIKWFTKEELEKKKYALLPHIKFYATEALVLATHFLTQ